MTNNAQARGPLGARRFQRLQGRPCRQRRLSHLALAIALATHPVAAVSQQPVQDSAARTTVLPFAPGEKLEYAISYGPLHVGHGSMELTVGDTIRGQPTYHATFHIQGGTFLFRVDDQTDSWFETTDLTSLRFTQEIHEGRYRAHRVFDIFPAERKYVRLGDTTYATVAAPLDDASFLYFVRTLVLQVGAQYTFDRYFQLAGNPIILRVLRAERITVPAGSFDAIVVQPIIATRGIFSEHGHAEVWLRADGGHEVLQMKSHVAFGSLSLYLTRADSTTPSERRVHR